MPGFIHQVEMKLDAAAAPERLRRIESWCGDWQIRFRVLNRAPGSENIRIAFDDPCLARAFVGHFGGVIVDDREIEHAMAGDANDEDAYDRLAREYTD
ncbi:hypothetical protein IP69_11690 [Bosea sp. AAP35]|uniref:hypothetical protein n=1 Tax=Bosea sp. AAP35 TaxID=1523417 RepID=UPI0006B9CF44|nr:hypothetical protein [Bosea sp. AAP35]KPF68321.1 hypothetical protein IP69_11690 [Bosea sp. AAP35]